MKNLIKTDFRRLLKDKLTIVLFVIALVLATVTPLLQAALFEVQKLIAEAPDMVSPIQAKSMLFVNFAYLSDVMFIVLILVPIILLKELNGMIRNKIVNGYSRKQVYFSLLITISTLITILLLVATIITSTVSLIAYPYSLAGDLFINDIPYILLSLLGGIILSILISSLIILFSIGLRIKVSSVILIAIFFVLTIVGTLVSTAVTNKPALKFLRIFNPVSMASILGQTTEPIYYIGQILVPLAYIALTILWGISSFKKRDIQ